VADYYEILGLNHHADSTQIRTAYKRLAMQYHPDRNPGNPQAEEIFKVVNEAYHILSDPLKKSRYDSRLNSQHSGPVYTEAYWREVQRKKNAQWQHAQKKRYVFDKNYFKIQGLAFLVFLLMSGICFGIIHTTNYYIALQYE
jgi:curved DNA-binding protein CbpA